MNEVFRPYLKKFVLVFFDDILVYSSLVEEHRGHLETVLRCLQEHKLYVNEKKCLFGQQKLDYLGHMVSGEGVLVNQTKIEAMLKWPKPCSLKELRGFLGLMGYHRRFVKGYAKLASPLTDLLKKDGFNWNEQAEVAFIKLKKAMTKVPVLALPDFSQEFVVEIDAKLAPGCLLQPSVI